MSSIAKFVRQAFAIHLQEKEKAFLEVKRLDYLTLDIKVPIPKNLVNKLNARELLKLAAHRNPCFKCIQLEGQEEDK